MIIDDVDAQNEIPICYHMRLDKISDNLLRAQAKKLVSLSASMDTWQQSKCGSRLKFCDTATCIDVRTMWSFYSSIKEDPVTSTREKRLKTVIETTSGIMDSRNIQDVVPGIRSAVPEQSLVHKHGRTPSAFLETWRNSGL